eukprot:6446891-Prymnesium_polylepis.1
MRTLPGGIPGHCETKVRSEPQAPRLRSPLGACHACSVPLWRDAGLDLPWSYVQSMAAQLPLHVGVFCFDRLGSGLVHYASPTPHSTAHRHSPDAELCHSPHGISVRNTVLRSVRKTHSALLRIYALQTVPYWR